MRARDRDSYPVAPRDSTYGCCNCGSYRRIQAGQKLYCTQCRAVAPMVDVVDAAPQPADDTLPPPRSSPGTGTG